MTHEDDAAAKEQERVTAARKAREDHLKRQEEIAKQQEEAKKAAEPKKAQAPKADEVKKVADREVKASGSKLRFRSSAQAKVKDGVEALSDHIGEGEAPVGEAKIEPVQEKPRKSAPEGHKQRFRSSSVVKVREDGTEVLGNKVRDNEKVQGEEE
jgi:hypothetical protein